jgi:hypothetical protein
MSYIRHDVYLTDGQMDKLRAAAKAGDSATVRIDPTVRPNRHLYLTATQIKKLKATQTPKDIKLSKTQLIKNGGFIISIPALLAGLGAAAGIASGAAGVARAVNTKKHESKMEAEAARHNKNVESMLRKAAAGKGAFLPRVSLKKEYGRGVYLPRKVR